MTKTVGLPRSAICLDRLPIIRPTLPELAEIEDVVRKSWEAGIVTVGATVRAFEEEVRRRTGVRHAVAVSSCTAGLMLVPRALKFPAGSEVIIPSFTFAATAHAVVWNQLIPVFCDCTAGTWVLDPEDVERNLSAKTVAICPVYIFGLPPDIDVLGDLGRRKGIPVYFDSAQGLGATYGGRPAGGFGVCEVFSLSPTKVVSAIEGGLVTTNDDGIAERMRCLRDYGKDVSNGEDMVGLGMSARMSELHAAVGLLSLRKMEELVKARLERIAVYRDRLSKLAGCHVQGFPHDRASSGNYFVLFVTNRARKSRDEVFEALRIRGIQTKRYFFPPLHQQTIFRQFPMRVSDRIANTLKASAEGLALPLYSHMTPEEQDRVCLAVEELLGQ